LLELLRLHTYFYLDDEKQGPAEAELPVGVVPKQ
jgi:hypothetical protein